MYNGGVDAEIITVACAVSRADKLAETNLMPFPFSGDAIAVIREANTINEDPYAYMHERVRKMEQ